MAYNKHGWVHGEVITAEKLNCIEDGIDCLANCSQIWLNSNPEGNFAAQDITLDTSRFSAFELYFITEENDVWQNICIRIHKQRAYRHNGKINSFVKHGNYERYFSVEDSKISFSDCKYGAKYNGKLIPYSIHAFV